MYQKTKIFKLQVLGVNETGNFIKKMSLKNPCCTEFESKQRWVPVRKKLSLFVLEIEKYWKKLF